MAEPSAWALWMVNFIILGSGLLLCHNYENLVRPQPCPLCLNSYVMLQLVKPQPCRQSCGCQEVIHESHNGDYYKCNNYCNWRFMYSFLKASLLFSLQTYQYKGFII